MTIFVTPNSVIFLNESLEEAGLALAFNRTSFLDNLKHIVAAAAWRQSVIAVIDTTHSVLAQYNDVSDGLETKMLRARACLTLLSAEEAKPLGFLMARKASELTLSSCEVVLSDLGANFNEFQSEIDKLLRTALTGVLAKSATLEEFVRKISSMTAAEAMEYFVRFKQLFEQGNNQLSIYLDLVNFSNVLSITNGFGLHRMSLYAALALQSAALRGLAEAGVRFNINDTLVDPKRFKINEILEQYKLSGHIRYTVAEKIADPNQQEKFSLTDASDIEIMTYHVTCSVNASEWASLSCAEECQLIRPTTMQLKIINPHTGHFQIVLADYPPISSDVSQFIVAYLFEKLFGIQATLIMSSASSPLLGGAFFRENAFHLFLAEIDLFSDVVKASKNQAQQLQLKKLRQCAQEIFAAEKPPTLDYFDLAIKCIHAAWIACFSDKKTRIDPAVFRLYAEQAIARITDMIVQTAAKFFLSYVVATLERNAGKFSESRTAAETAMQLSKEYLEIKPHCLMQLTLAWLRDPDIADGKARAQNSAEQAHQLLSTAVMTDHVSSPSFDRIAKIINLAEGSVHERVNLNLMQAAFAAKDIGKAMEYANAVLLAANKRITVANQLGAVEKNYDEQWAYAQTACCEVMLAAAAQGQAIDMTVLTQNQAEAYSVYIPDATNVVVNFNVFRCALATARVYCAVKNYDYANTCYEVAAALSQNPNLKIDNNYLQMLQAVQAEITMALRAVKPMCA